MFFVHSAWPGASIRFKRGQLTREIESVVADIDASIKSQHAFVKRIFVEAEPAKSS